VWDFPSRKEKFELQFEKKPPQWKPTEAGNFVNASNDTDRVMIHFNTEKRKHQPIHFELQFDSGKSVLDTYNNRLSDLLRRSYKLYKRKYVFIPKNTWGSNRNKEDNEYKPVESSTPSSWLRKLSGRVININSLCSAFISYWWNKMNSNEKEILVLRRAYTGSEDRPIDVDNRALPVIDLDRPIPVIPVNRSSRTLLSQRPRKVRKDTRGQDTHERRYENWIRWYEKNGNKAKHNVSITSSRTRGPAGCHVNGQVALD
jgi:hypothetical protein